MTNVIASKENAQKAINLLKDFAVADDGDADNREFLHSFLEAASKRLPSEKAIAADKKRKRKRKPART